MYCFVSFYHNKILNFFANIFVIFRDILISNEDFHYLFLLNFAHNKINAMLQTLKKKNLTSIAAGFFIKYFNNQKNKKKTKLVKLLTAKYFRKIFIVTKLKLFNVVVKKTPLDLVPFFIALTTPIITPFQDPYNEKPIEENEKNKYNFKFNYFIFKNNMFFHKRRQKKRGRIKRKILRKLVIENKVVD